MFLFTFFNQKFFLFGQFFKIFSQLKSRKATPSALCQPLFFTLHPAVIVPKMPLPAVVLLHLVLQSNLRAYCHHPPIGTSIFLHLSPTLRILFQSSAMYTRARMYGMCVHRRVSILYIGFLGFATKFCNKKTPTEAGVFFVFCKTINALRIEVPYVLCEDHISYVLLHEDHV